MEKKIDILKRLMAENRWEQAIKYAAKFPKLGGHKDAIIQASSAMLSPNFYKGIGKDPAQLIEAGKIALIERYKL